MQIQSPEYHIYCTVRPYLYVRYYGTVVPGRQSYRITIQYYVAYTRSYTP